MKTLRGKSTQLSAEQVATYLKLNPLFFNDRDDLLLHMHLPHQRGSSISLVERQVSLLRERNLEMRRRLNHLLKVAQKNDALLEKSITLILALYEAQTLNEVHKQLKKSLLKDFKVDFMSFTLITDKLFTGSIPTKATHTLTQSLNDLFDYNETLCGHLRKEEIKFLFPDYTSKIQSCAVVPVNVAEHKAFLAVGSKSPDHYRGADGLFFLKQIANALGKALQRLL